MFCPININSNGSSSFFKNICYVLISGVLSNAFIQHLDHRHTLIVDAAQAKLTYDSTYEQQLDQAAFQVRGSIDDARKKYCTRNNPSKNINASDEETVNAIRNLAIINSRARTIFGNNVFNAFQKLNALGEERLGCSSSITDEQIRTVQHNARLEADPLVTLDKQQLKSALHSYF